MNVSYKNLDDFLSKHKMVKSKDSSSSTSSLTHTKIGDKTANIYAGSYSIEKEEKRTFYDLYCKKVFHDKKPEYLTEKQIENGPVLIDFDLKFDYEVDKRMYSEGHVMDVLSLYLDQLKIMFQLTQQTFPVFIFQKDDVNRCIDKNITKDGIHIIIGIQMDHILQSMFRDNVLAEIGQVWDRDELKMTNTWENVIDDSISKGTTNWQVYGSRKPGHLPYKLTHHFNVTYDPSDKEFEMISASVKIPDSDIMMLLSAQYDEHPIFELQPAVATKYTERKTKPKPKKKSCFRIVEKEEEEVKPIELEEIQNKEQFERVVNSMLNSFSESEYGLREIHEYTQILPEAYYEDGSHTKNRCVAFALKHTDERLFLSWVMLRSKNPSFDYSSIPDLFHQWNTYFNKKGEVVLTKNSIIFWAKNDAPPEQFLQVKSSTLDHYIDETLTTNTSTDYDIAKVLYHMNKDTYCCTNITTKTWFVYKNHKWREDRSMSIRNKISEEVYKLYNEKLNRYVSEIQGLGANETENDRQEFLGKQINKIGKTCEKLKKASDKNNIFREAMEIFFNDDFSKKIDVNKYLLCFTNGIVDMKQKVFRAGMPEDYVSKCTNNAYIENIVEYMDAAAEFLEREIEYESIRRKATELGLDELKLISIVEIHTYMNQLYPIKELCDYMWSHLASCLIGENINQKCNIYIGSGSNGKSSIVDLMSHAMGDYKGVMPITVVTEKRAGVGGTQSELIALKGVRFVVVQESTKGARFNEGVLKELTGGDTIVARQLFKESESFTPQFNLILCTNNYPEVDANDDGTWRRMNCVPHYSKFVDNIDDPINTRFQYVFKKDKNMKEKMAVWAQVFISMLVQKVFETQGIVEDCLEVTNHSNKYRQSQDHISSFINERIIEDCHAKLGKQELIEEFKRWYQENNGNTHKMPKGAELKQIITDKWGEPNSKGWNNIRINYPDDDIEL